MNKKIKLSLETEDEKYSVEFDPDSNIYKYCRHFRELLQSQGFLHFQDSFQKMQF